MNIFDYIMLGIWGIGCFIGGCFTVGYFIGETQSVDHASIDDLTNDLNCWKQEAQEDNMSINMVNTFMPLLKDSYEKEIHSLENQMKERDEIIAQFSNEVIKIIKNGKL